MGSPGEAAVRALALPLWLGACGDALLPGDFTGPPAASVSGDVVASADGSPKDATHPQLALQWLIDLGEPKRTGDALESQLVTFARSSHLASDWEIGLGSPRDDIKMPVALSGTTSPTTSEQPPRVGIAKLVYFDDRVPDEHLDWTCTGDACDRVKAVSDEFVVYFDRPLACSSQPEHRLHPAFAAGYHYFEIDAVGVARELENGASLRFTVTDRDPAAGDPTAALRAFAPLLKRTLALALIDQCR